MKLKNTQAEFDLITKLIEVVNSKDEYEFLGKRMKEISSSASFFIFYTDVRRCK